MKSPVEVAKRPAFFYGFTVCRSGGLLYAPAVVVKYIRALGEICDRPVIICPVSVRDDAPPEWEVFEFPHNVEVLEIDAFESMIEGLRNENRLSAALLDQISGADAVLARYPDHYWRELLAFADRQGIPFKLHLVGDPIALNRALQIRSSGRTAVVAAGKGAVWRVDRARLRRSLRGRGEIASNGTDAVRTYFPERLDEAQILVSSSVDSSDLCSHTILENPTIRTAFIGIDRPEKRLDIALEVAGRFSDMLTLDVVGPSDAANAPANVTFHGPMNRAQIFEILDRSDVLLVPSESEGTPRVILEAMARGVLVIASDAGGIPDSLGDGSRGLLFQSTLAQDLARSVQWVLDNREAARTLAAQGHSFAERNVVESFLKQLLSYRQD